MATYTYTPAETVGGKSFRNIDLASLQHDWCSDFDANGFALPAGRCWSPVWSMRDGDPCAVCGELVNRREPRGSWERPGQPMETQA